jgi:hypothetical protein
MDVERLYPSIPHDLCIELLTKYLDARCCTYTAYLMAILDIVLKENHCYFAGYYWHQIIGFATRVSCGVEVSHLFLHALFEPVFSDLRYAQYLIYNKRYADGGVLIWAGSRLLLDAMFSDLNSRCDEINLMFEVSLERLVILDVLATKGSGWRKTGFLDTEVYQKEMNRYLFTPPTSEHPRHTHFGLIKGELLRYIKKSSSFSKYVEMACLFYQRLRARGFSLSLLSEAFSKAPEYDTRAELLAKALPPRSIDMKSSPVLVFSAVFSRSKEAAGLSRAIFLNQSKLRAAFEDAPSFRDMRLLNAWRVAPRIGGRLLTFRFPTAAKEAEFVKPAR